MDPKILKSKGICYAGYPDVEMLDLVLNPKKGVKEMKRVKHLLFGDYIKLDFRNGKPIKKTIDGEEYVYGRARGMSGYVPVDNILPDRILEVNFIDVGQGDGCHIVTPDDQHFLVDAGASNNMFRFLKWRFNLNRAKVKIPAFNVVISHSDLDHYSGFNAVFKASGIPKGFTIKKIYHNGMIEASGSDVESLGILKGQDITGLCLTDAQYKKRVKAVAKKGKYIEMLESSKAPKEALYKGYGSIYKKKGMNMEVLAPVHEKSGKTVSLPVLGNKGVTKNGHSVVLKLNYGKLRMILGGDLNSESEDYLMEKYSGVAFGELRRERMQKNISAAKAKELDTKINNAIEKVRKVFECDIAKSCHHGSPDFTHEFLKVLNPIATVISSGDEEPHCHPRPDTLGTIGKHSRGDRSLIFSTELARTGLEFLDIGKILAEREKAGLVSTKIKERVVTRYGMINVRSDGEKVVIAQKLERNAPRGSWDIHKLVWNDEKNEFEYIDYLKRIK
jgi:beta-lactamase superfamily II metal-dependent hydrolase